MDQILTILGSVGFNWHVALANFVNFLIILFILNKFFFGKLGKAIDERKSVIERGLAQASDAEKKLMQAEDEKKEIIKGAKKESHAIISEAETQAVLLASEIKDQAQRDAEKVREELAVQEAGLTKQVEHEFAQAAPALVARLYAKTLKKNLTAEDNNELVANMN